MKIAFYGGETAGYITLLTLIAKQYKVVHIYPEDNKIEFLAKAFNIQTMDKKLLDDKQHFNTLQKSIDLLVCCHARKILKRFLVDKILSINLHPCLYKYKGGFPIQKLIKDKNPKASVACHYMVEKVDAGKTIVEEFITINNISNKNEAQVYNELYPLYSKVLLKSLTLLNKL